MDQEHKNHTIKIPEKLFMGFHRAKDDSDVPLGVMVPFGTDAASKKAIAKIENWTKRGGTSSTPAHECVTLDNKPISGFRISRSLRRLGWGSNSNMVRVEDPRGFELEISVSNLLMVSDNNVLHNGEIVQECVWGRDGGENKLLPVNSTPYVQAVENTERMSKSVSSRSVPIGSEILLHSGVKGIYMGAMFAMQKNKNNSKDFVPHFEFVEKKKHIVRTESNGSPVYTGYASLKISEVLTPGSLTKTQAQEMINADVSSNKTTFSNLGTGYYPIVRHLSYDRNITWLPIERISITEQEAIDMGIWNYSQKAIIFAVHKTTGENLYVTNDNFTYTGRRPNVYSSALRTYLQSDEFNTCIIDSKSLETGATMLVGATKIVKLQDIDLFILQTGFVDDTTKVETKFYR